MLILVAVVVFIAAQADGGGLVREAVTSIQSNTILYYYKYINSVRVYTRKRRLSVKKDSLSSDGAFRKSIH